MISTGEGVPCACVCVCVDGTGGDAVRWERTKDAGTGGEKKWIDVEGAV